MHPPPPGPPPPAGRRGNGLSASEWGALVDVDPRLSDQLLQRLADAGVAAHVEPAGATTDPVSRAGSFPSRPLDRLWVDVAVADAARTVVSGAATELVAGLPGDGGVEQFLHSVPRGASGRVLAPPAGVVPPPAPDDTDAAWREIVASFERSSDAPVPPWPVVEDVEQPRRRRPERPESPPRRDPPAAGLPGWVEPAALPDEGHYVPPPPPPSPRLQPRTLGAVAAVLLGLLLLTAPSVLDIAPSGGSYLLGMVLTAGGAGALVWWMRDAPGPDDGPDDGAVV